MARDGRHWHGPLGVDRPDARSNSPATTDLIDGESHTMSDAHWIGVDLGGTKILAGLFDDDMKLLRPGQGGDAAAEAGPSAVFERIDKAVDQGARGSRRRSRPASAAWASACRARSRRTRCACKFAPNLDWHDVDLSAHLPANWTWPTFIENDVRIGTFGEWRHGAAKGREARPRHFRRHGRRRGADPRRQALSRLQLQRRRDRPHRSSTGARARRSRTSPAAGA